MKALIIVDIQYDFLPGGALAVNEGDRIIRTVNQLQAKFPLVVATQDWHPADHGSFAMNHSGRRPGEFIELAGLQQILWPSHCVQGTQGAKFPELLDTKPIKKIFQKGTDPSVDSYSGFFDNAHRKDTGLAAYLKQKEVKEVYIVGLATDYCVKFTALDAAELGFTTYLVEDACRGVELNPGDVKKAIEQMKAAGVHIVNSRSVL